MTVTYKKKKAYDILCQIDSLQKMLQQVNKEIMAEMNKPKEEKINNV
jgi:hypothetical protein